MKNINRKTIIVGVIILVIIITALVAIFYRQQKNVSAPSPIAIVNSIPSNNSTGTSVFDPITFTFNQPVDSKTVHVSSEPQESWTITQSAPDIIKVDHQQYLKVATTYKLTLLQNGNLAGTLTFETAQEQNDPRQLQSLQTELNKDYPLASFTPYETSNYRVVYSAPLTLEIDLKGVVSSSDAISQVQSWVKSHGIDPATHKYIVVSPSPTP